MAGKRKRKKTKATAKKTTTKKTTASTKKYKYKRAKVLKVVRRQTGTRKSVNRDAARKAMPPGKRRSKSGKVYYEYRKNRTDLRGRI